LATVLQYGAMRPANTGNLGIAGNLFTCKLRRAQLENGTESKPLSADPNFDLPDLLICSIRRGLPMSEDQK
jgi:hypothetical protein